MSYDSYSEETGASTSSRQTTSSSDDVKPKKTLHSPVVEGRSCTDIIFLILFVLFWCGFVVVLALGYRKGNPDLLIHGYDSNGNICGRPNPQLTNGKDESAYPYLFYGNPLDPYQAQICVKSCPTAFGWSISGTTINVDSTNVYCLPQYNRPSDTSTVPLKDVYTGVGLAGYGGCTGKNCSCYFGYPTVEVFRRCVGNPSYPVNGTVLVSDALQSVTQKMLGDIYDSWVIILVCGFIALVLSFAWLILLRLCAGCMVWTCIFLVIALASLLVAFLWYETYTNYEIYNNGQGSTPSGVASYHANYVTFLILAIIASVFLVVMLLVLLFMIRRIRIAVLVVKTAAKALGNIPGLLLLPLVIFIVFGGFFALWITCWMYLASAETPTYNAQGQFVDYERAEGVRGLQIYHMFALLWSLAFALALNELVIAGAVASWYFRGPEGEFLPRFPVFASVRRAFRYHLGTVAFGSLIVAIITFIRLVVRYLQYQAAKQHNRCLAFCLGCIGYCLRCLSDLIKFINKNAYIIVAIEGTSFCKSAQQAVSYLLANAARLFALNFVSSFLIFLGKIFVTAVTGIVAMEWLRLTPNLSYWAIPFILIIIMAYAISAGFMAVFEMTIDTIFLCFCVDESKFKGEFMPSELHALADVPADPKAADKDKDKDSKVAKKK